MAISPKPGKSFDTDCGTAHVVPRPILKGTTAPWHNSSLPEYAIPGPIDLAGKVFKRTGGVNDDVGNLETLLPGSLGTNPGPGVLLAAPVPLDDTSHLLGRVHIGDDNRVELVSPASFHEQGNVVDHDDLTTCATGSVIDSSRSLLDQRVDDVFQTPSGSGISKDDGPQHSTVQGTIVVQHLLAEDVDDLTKPLGSDCHDVTGELVVIDDHGAVCGQQLGHRRLAAGNSARQANPNDAGFFVSTWHQDDVFSSDGVNDPPGVVTQSNGVRRHALPDWSMIMVH